MFRAYDNETGDYVMDATGGPATFDTIGELWEWLVGDYPNTTALHARFTVEAT